MNERPANSGKRYGFWAIAVAIVLVVVLDILDLNVSVHPSLIIFYLIPIFLATWFSGTRAGMFVAVVSILSWFIIYIPRVMHLYYKPLYFYINMASRTCFTLLAVYVLAKLKAALKQIKLQNEELKKLNELKSIFVANVAHELKNPLAIIRESLSLILDKMAGEVNPEQKEILEMGKRSTDRLIRLVGNLLDLSQIELGKMKLKKETIDLPVIVEGVLKTYEREIFKKQLRLEKKFQPDLGLFEGDRDKLMEVFINLLNNAIKYTPAGKIKVELTGTETKVRCEIADTGPGIPPESVGTIFDKFERIMAEKQEGTGLGLSIVKDIVELHKGKIWVESEPGKGSKFIFTLPRNTVDQ